MTGILVFGDNHLILEGPEPGAEQARALVRFWSVIQIGRGVPPELAPWRVITRAFRGELAWAWVAGDAAEHSEAVRVLLDELRARGVAVRAAGPDAARGLSR